MTDRDPFLDIFPHIQASCFASIEWPNWPDLVYNPEFSRDPVKVFKYGIIYTVQCLQTESVMENLGLDTNVFIANWNPKFDEALFEKIIKGDRLMTATFHSGAKHGIDKLRGDMPEELEADGLGQCVDALEVGVHQQFLKRIAGVPELAEELELRATTDDVMRMLESEKEEGEGEDEEDRIMDMKKEHDLDGQVDSSKTEVGEGGEEEALGDGFVDRVTKAGRKRNQAKSKKAKKTKKISKKGTMTALG
jgi:hypothetical protein